MSVQILPGQEKQPQQGDDKMKTINTALGALGTGANIYSNVKQGQANDALKRRYDAQTNKLSPGTQGDE